MWVCGAPRANQFTTHTFRAGLIIGYGRGMSPLISVGDASVTAMHQCVAAHCDGLLQSVVSIFLKKEGKRPQHCGSGIFILFRGREYLMTAAHVSNQQKDGDIFFAGGFGKFVPIDGRWSESVEVPQYGGDPLDVAVLSIDPVARSRLLDVTFLQIDHSLHREEYRRSHRFMAMGYPRSQNKSVKSATSLPAHARSYIANPRWDQRVDSRPYVGGKSHLVLEWSRDAAYDGNGVLVTPTALPGVSGGPIFEIGNYADHGILSGTQIPQPVLAGIVTDYLSDEKIILGTRINAIVDGLDAKRAWPAPY